MNQSDLAVSDEVPNPDRLAVDRMIEFRIDQFLLVLRLSLGELVVPRHGNIAGVASQEDNGLLEKRG